MISKTKEIYEILIRFDEEGIYKGSHIQYIEKVIEEIDGKQEVLSEKITPAETIARADISAYLV